MGSIYDLRPRLVHYDGVHYLECDGGRIELGMREAVMVTQFRSISNRKRDWKDARERLLRGETLGGLSDYEQAVVEEYKPLVRRLLREVEGL